MTRAYNALRITPRDQRWRLLSFRAVVASDEELRAAETEAGARLQGSRYRIAFGRSENSRRDPNNHRRVLVDVGETATAFAGALPLILVKRANAAWRAESTV